MIRSRSLNVVVILIGALFLALAVNYGLEALEAARLYLQPGYLGSDPGAILYTWVALFDVTVAIWCIRGGVLNLRAIRRQRNSGLTSS